MGLWFSGAQRFWASGRKDTDFLFLFYLKMGKGKGRGEKEVHRDFLPLMQLPRSRIQAFRCCELVFSHLWGITGYNNKDNGLASTEGAKLFVL